MSTFLELCQRYRLEAGIDGSGPTTVVGNSDNEYARIVNWVADADVEIQMKYDDWRFMWGEFSFNTTASDGRYTEAEALASIGASLSAQAWGEDSFRYYLTSSGQSTEQWMQYREWNAFYPYWRNGSMRTREGPPSVWTVRPDGDIELGYVPDAIYTITGQVQLAPIRMDGNSDEPRYPSQYHMLPVWYAIINYGGFEESSFQYQHAQNMFNRLWPSFERTQRNTLPTFGPSIDRR